MGEHMSRRDARLTIITDALHRLIPGASPAFLSVEVTETLPGSGKHRNTWTGTIDALAERVFTALYGRPKDQPDAAQPVSPLQQAEDAKRRRDIGGELGALLEGGHALESAPWYPAQPGDILHVHYEQVGTIPPCGETYLVQDLPGNGGLLRLRLISHSHPKDSDQPGAFEVTAADDPLYEAWFEAGPHRLTIVRNGRVVHDGPSAAARS
jgi:hypothetical protein